MLTSPREIPAQIRSVSSPVLGLGVVLAILYFGRLFFVTLLTAIIFAFILEPFVSLLVRARLPRGIATFLVCSFAALALWFAGVAAYTQVAQIAGELPKYNQRISELVDSITTRINRFEDSVSVVLRPRAKEPQPPAPAKRGRRTPAINIPVPPNITGAIPEVRIHDDHNPIADYIYSRLGTLYESALMASFVPFLVYFMLSWRDHLHRSFLHFFHGQQRMVAARALQGIADLVRAFVVGNFVMGIILAFASSLAFSLVRLPYPVLAGTLSGFLSLIPYIGMPLALLVPILASLAGAGFGSLAIVLVVVAGLHIFALNVLYPTIVGSRVHLNPLVVTISLMFWGFLWDAPGLILAIPLTAAIKAVCDNVQVLRPYGRFLSD